MHAGHRFQFTYCPLMRSAVSTSTLRRPTSGRKCYITPAFTRVPAQRDKNKTGYFTHAFCGAHKWVEGTASSSRVPQQGDKFKSGYPTPAFSRAHKWAEATATSSGVPQQGDKIKSGYFTPAFSRGHKWAEKLHNPCLLEGAGKRGQNQKWLTQPCIRKGPQVGRSAT